MPTNRNNSLRLFKLIEKAAKAAGNESRLAEALKETRHNVNSWKHGRRTCPVEMQVLLANIAGESVCAVVAQAILEKHEGTCKGTRLEEAFK